jgi:hypothetical protein
MFFLIKEEKRGDLRLTCRAVFGPHSDKRQGLDYILQILNKNVLLLCRPS